MKRTIFLYLKKHNLTTIQLVNKLFVSSFLRYYGLVPHNNPLLQEFTINPQDAEEEILQKFIVQLNACNCTYSLEDLTQLFEFVISPSDRKITGAIYTPSYIRKRIVEQVIDGIPVSELEKKRFADISCGCGGFFLTIARVLHDRCRKSYFDIYRENIFGIDVQGYSIERTKLLLSLLALMNGEDCNLHFNLYKANTLSFDFNIIRPLDIIVGNPPYVCLRNMSEDSRQLLSRWKVAASGNSDLYIPFFQIAIENIIEGGKIGLITMNSFLTSLNGRALREYFQERSYSIEIIDFRGCQIFSGRSTYTCLFFLTKEHSVSIKYCSLPDGNISQHDRLLFKTFKYHGLDSKKGWKFNHSKEIKDLENIGVPLGKFCQTRHGIATLCNKVYIFQCINQTKDTLVFAKDGTEFEIEKGICRKIVNSNKFNSDVDLDDITEYVIYPYFLNTFEKAEIIDEEILKSKYPLAYQYLKGKKELLDKRDKGHTETYPAWYAYGRTQSLVMPKCKLFFPKIANKSLRCTISEDSSLLLYNGMSFVSNDEIKIKILKKILESDIFWNYVVANGKPYSSGYYSLNGVNIMNFGIPNFTHEQMKELLFLTDYNDIDDWLRNFYS